MRLVLNGGNWHIRREFARFDRLQIGPVVIARLEHWQRGILGNHTHIVEVGRFIGDFPVGSIERVQPDKATICPDYPEKCEP